MLIRPASDVPSSEITPESVYLSRRAFIQAFGGGAALAAGALAPSAALAGTPPTQQLSGIEPSAHSTDEDWDAFEDITGYNNFVEFGLAKSDPARYAGEMTIAPWSVAVEGLVGKPAVYDLDDLVGPHTLEERVYRLRCVEAWSMVIPWVGFPLADLIKRLEPASSARFIEFTTLHRPSEMRNLGHSILDWPYREGLRLDEAMHPLTLIAVGLYGRSLLNQNGAPLRLVVPWKYGFKSIKSIVKMRFVADQPTTVWSRASPEDFGFYANVNPDVARPESQRTERRIGAFFRRKTQLFNGYADQVESLYAGMDLTKDY